MPKKAPFKIGYSDDAVGDLKWFGKQKGPKIVRQIGNRLSHEADVKTKNRKPLNPPILDSAWELRCGQNNSVRVFYDVDARDRKVTPGKKPLAGLRRVRKLSEVLAETRERQKGRPLKSQEEVMALLKKG